MKCMYFHIHCNAFVLINKIYMVINKIFSTVNFGFNDIIWAGEKGRYLRFEKCSRDWATPCKYIVSHHPPAWIFGPASISSLFHILFII